MNISAESGLRFSADKGYTSSGLLSTYEGLGLPGAIQPDVNAVLSDFDRKVRPRKWSGLDDLLSAPPVTQYRGLNRSWQANALLEQYQGARGKISIKLGNQQLAEVNIAITPLAAAVDIKDQPSEKEPVTPTSRILSSLDKSADPGF